MRPSWVPQAAADILDCLAGAHTRLAEGQGAELLWRDASDKRLYPVGCTEGLRPQDGPAFEAALFTGARLAGDTNALGRNRSEPLPEILELPFRS